MNNAMGGWIDGILEKGIPDEAKALSFNLYDDGGGSWSAELVGTGSFDPEDEDWACDETCDFGTRDKPLKWEKEASWEEILDECAAEINEYLKNGKYASLMKKCEGIGVGFVDGDGRILYKK
jgi:hypothetical protein